jgi:predicted DNA-binding mobile mystery protein A
MSVKNLATRQYQTLVNHAAKAMTYQTVLPPEGWIATTRKALGMSAAQLARRLGLTSARIFQAEQAEPLGGVTLKTMHAMAEAMGCRFVYAIVPADGRVEQVILAQAQRKAQALVGRASIHMALEKQSLSPEDNTMEVERITNELLRTMPSDFWVNT